MSRTPTITRNGSCRPSRIYTRRAVAVSSLALRRMLSVVLLASAPTLAGAGEVREHPGGFWKCKPPSSVNGAFDNEDPVGLAAHSHVATNCELHWSDGHDATYCFATPPSLLMFKDDPDAILGKAHAFWRLSHPQRSSAGTLDGPPQ